MTPTPPLDPRGFPALQAALSRRRDFQDPDLSCRLDKPAVSRICLAAMTLVLLGIMAGFTLSCFLFANI